MLKALFIAGRFVARRAVDVQSDEFDKVALQVLWAIRSSGRTASISTFARGSLSWRSIGNRRETNSILAVIKNPRPCPVSVLIDAEFNRRPSPPPRPVASGNILPTRTV